MDKQRIIQEYVPGKQVTIAHVIPNPDPSLYKKLGVVGEPSGALGILTVKAASVEIVFVDRFSGSLVIRGTTAAVEASVREVIDVLNSTMGFSPCPISRS